MNGKSFNINPITSVGVIAILFCAFSNVNSYSKYGRGCADIGCLPNEICTMSHDSCGFGQKDGKECGSYPTCQKNGGNGGGSVRPSGASLNPAPDNTIYSPSSNPSLNPNSYQNNNNNNNKPKPTPIDGHYVFGAPNPQQVNSNFPIFPYNQPTQPPAFQQFPQPNHPGAGGGSTFSISSPHNVQPQNPYSPPFVFGQIPFFNPGGTGGPPGSLSSLYGMGQNPPNWYNKPPNQNPYNRQTQSHPNSASSAEFTSKVYALTACLLLTVAHRVLFS